MRRRNALHLELLGGHGTTSIDWAFTGVGAVGEALMCFLRVFNRGGTPG